MTQRFQKICSFFHSFFTISGLFLIVLLVHDDDDDDVHVLFLLLSLNLDVYCDEQDEDLCLELCSVLVV